MNISATIGFISIPFIAFLFSRGHSDKVTVSSPCGSSLGGNSGEIEYKLSEYYLPGEKCVWTLRSNSSSFQFTKESSNFSNEDTTLSIHTFGEKGAIANGTMGEIDQQQILFMRGTLAVIIFTASFSEKPGKGFKMFYKATGSSSKFPPGRDMIVSNVTGFFNHTPSNQGARKGKDTSLLVVARQWRNTITHPPGGRNFSMSVQVPVMTPGGCCSGRCSDGIYHYASFYRISSAHEAQRIGYLTRCDAAPMGPFHVNDVFIALLSYSYGGGYYSGVLQIYWEIY